MLLLSIINQKGEKKILTRVCTSASRKLCVCVGVDHSFILTMCEVFSVWHRAELLSNHKEHLSHPEVLHRHIKSSSVNFFSHSSVLPFLSSVISWPFINYCLLAIMADWSITVSNRYGHYSYQRKRQTYQGNNFLTLKLFKSIAKQCSVCLLLPFVFQPFQLHPKPDINDGNQIV